MPSCNVCAATVLNEASFCNKCGAPVESLSTDFNTEAPAPPPARAAPKVPSREPPIPARTSRPPYNDPSPQYAAHPEPNQYVALPVPQPQYSGKKRQNLAPDTDRIIVQTNAKAGAALEGLKKYYSEFVRPVEIDYKFSQFHSAPWNDVDFDAPPMVLLLGQYSVGKTSFINYIIEKDFQNMRIGPEPTTDKFTAIMYGNSEQVVPGNAAASTATMPFVALQKFGMSFLNRFEAALCNSPVLQQLTFIDTPGVLSGEKQRVNRQYNFTEVIEWFADRCDRIILLFDAHKLDISDEFKQSIEVLNGHDDKVRCILNKADSVSAQQLMRVYGALMWSLGKVFKSPEVVRVYTGSFWAQPLQDRGNQEVLLQEEADLLADLRSLPRSKAIRRLNEMVKRCRQVKVHALIIEHLRAQIGFFGKKKKQAALLEDLLNQFKAVQRAYDLPAGDFPHMSRFRDVLKEIEIWTFPELNKRKIEKLDWVLNKGISELIRMIPSINDRDEVGPGANFGPNRVASPSNAQYSRNPPSGHSANDPTASPAPSYQYAGAMFGDDDNADNPFASEDDNTPVAWIIDENLRRRWTAQFYTLKLLNGKLSGQAARPLMLQSGLSSGDLKRIWVLSDMDRDGHLDQDEFIVMQYITMNKVNNPSQPLPTSLELAVIPPSKRYNGAAEAKYNEHDIEGSPRYGQ